MKFYKANWDTILLRYYLMMATVIISVFIGYPFLSIFGVLFFLSALMGINIKGILGKESSSGLTVENTKGNITEVNKAA